MLVKEGGQSGVLAHAAALRLIAGAGCLLRCHLRLLLCPLLCFLLAIIIVIISSRCLSTSRHPLRGLLLLRPVAILALVLPTPLLARAAPGPCCRCHIQPLRLPHGGAGCRLAPCRVSGCGLAAGGRVPLLLRCAAQVCQEAAAVGAEGGSHGRIGCRHLRQRPCRILILLVVAGPQAQR